MKAPTRQTRIHTRPTSWALAAVALLVLGCGQSQTEAPPAIDLAPFKDLARSSDCSDIQNRLFLIDHTLVLWEREGSCPDGAFLVRLNGGTLDQVLCELRDSIGGQVRVCREVQYRSMFETIVANLDEPDLGLGREHVVEPIEF